MEGGKQRALPHTQPLLAQLAETAIANAGADLPHQVEQKGDVVQADQPDA